MYIHGGHDIREGTLDSFWKIDLSGREYEWEKLVTKGVHKPGKIAYHTLTLYDTHKIILIGGSELGEDNPHIYGLDLHTMTWHVHKEHAPEELSSIDEHTASLYNDKIYVFGGNVHGYKSNKLICYDTKSLKWEIIKVKNSPPERSSHSAVVYEGKIYVFGGKSVENDKLGDFWVYDIEANAWNEIKSSESEWPISRSGHSTGIFKN